MQIIRESVYFLTIIYLLACKNNSSDDYSFEVPSSNSSTNQEDRNDKELNEADFFRVADGWFPLTNSNIPASITIQFYEANSYRVCEIILTGSPKIDTSNFHLEELKLETSNCNSNIEKHIVPNLIFSFALSTLSTTQNEILLSAFQKSSNVQWDSFENKMYGGNCSLYTTDSFPTENCYFLGYETIGNEVKNVPLTREQNPDAIRILGIQGQSISEFPS